MDKGLRVLLAGLLLAASSEAVVCRASGTPQDNKHQRSEAIYRQRLVKQVRHQLLMLPWYSVFDNLAFQVDRDKVTLIGQVVLPVLKSDAENAVKSVEGVATVVNRIEVLPLSPMDDQLRRAEFRTIYGAPGLQRYGLGAVPSIHIIVKNGHVTLEGFVDSEMDRNIANIRANQVPNVFSVKNNLIVARSSK